MTYDLETFAFPERILERARKITLADLLDTPFSQAWAVSMLANATNCSSNFAVVEDDEILLEAKMMKLLSDIPYEERSALFSMASSMVRERQQKKHESNLRAAA